MAQNEINTTPPTPKPPTPQQVPGAAPTAILPGTHYDSAQTAAVTVINSTNPTSISENREYAGRTVRDGTGDYVNTKNAGTEAGAPHGSVPEGTTSAALWHTHGANTPGYDNENFSSSRNTPRGTPNDIDNAKKAGVPSYLGTPSGAIKVYNPATGRTTVIQQPQ